MIRDQKGWIQQYGKRGALWIHDDNPKRPHVRLSAGDHSTGFFNGELVMEDPMFLDDAAGDLQRLLHRAGFEKETVDKVVGPAMGAITLAHDLARVIGASRERPCLRAYTEKHEDADGKKSMVFNKTTVKPGEIVLLAEDTITTGDSLEMAGEAVLGKGGILLPFVAALVNRSGLKEIGGKKIVALIDRHMPKWAPEECPLCKKGSEALYPPKKTENWERLNAKY